MSLITRNERSVVAYVIAFGTFLAIAGCASAPAVITPWPQVPPRTNQPRWHYACWRGPADPVVFNQWGEQGYELIAASSAYNGISFDTWCFKRQIDEATARPTDSSGGTAR